MVAERIKVLMVDDNTDLTNIFQDYVAFYEDIELIGVAENGLRLLEMLEESRPDVIILDIVMPSLDGLEVLKRLQGSRSDKPKIIVLSALSNELVTSEAMEYGADLYLTKPVDFKLLIEKIRMLSDAK